MMMVVYLLTFLSVVLLAEFSFGRLRAAAGTKHVNRRLGLIAGGKSRDEVLSLLRRAHGGGTTRPLITPLLDWLGHRLGQAGMQVSARAFLTGMLTATAAIGVIFPALAQLSGKFNSVGAFAVLLVFAVALGFGLPIMYINKKATNRVKLFDTQFPVALDIFVRGLRAGHPVSAALDLLTTEMPDPCGSEFGIVIDETNYGLNLREALINLSDRIDSQDVQMFVVCVSIQSETGGNLAEILEGLTKVIRERASMVLKVRALSSEGKMTGTMLSILPVFTFTITFISSPNFYLDVADDPMFMPGFGIILTLYVLGILTIKKMVNLKV
jgi:tight adherence protein B